MMKRQMRLIEKDEDILLPPIQVHLDQMDKEILYIFQKNPDRKWKVSQICSILIHNGHNINSAMVARKLDVLCTLTILSKEKHTGRVYRYTITIQ